MVPPPLNINVATKFAKIFFSLIDKQFPKNNKLSKIFNRNAIKISYSCLPNLKQMVSSNNNCLLQIHRKKESPKYVTAGKKTAAYSTRSASPNVSSTKQRGQKVIQTIKKLTSNSQKMNSRLGSIYTSYLLSWNIKEPQHLETTFGN